MEYKSINIWVITLEDDDANIINQRCLLFPRTNLLIKNLQNAVLRWSYVCLERIVLIFITYFYGEDIIAMSVRNSKQHMQSVLRCFGVWP